MPQQRRFRRLGSATTAVSAGALALVFLGAPAAYAGTAAAPNQCKKGTDPASTIENWKCQWKNWEDSLKPKPKPTPKPTPKPAESTKPPKTDRGEKKKKTPRADRPRVTIPRQNLPDPSGPTTMNRTDNLQPYQPGNAPSTSNLPGVLPTPQVANDPNALQPQPGAMPQTRLISPVAASEHDSQEMVWVAGVAGVAGAMIGINLSALGRRLRRPRA